MKIQLSKELIAKIEGKEVKKKTRNAYDRLHDAVKIMNKENPNDRLLFNNDYTVCFIELKDIYFLSNNDLLRMDNREIYKFKMSWHNRIHNLIKDSDISGWEETKKSPLLIEFLYKSKNAQLYDPDAVCAAFKSPLDGLVKSGLIRDDTINEVPLIIPRQEKTKGINELYIVLSPMPDIKKYYTDVFQSVISGKT